VLFAPDLVAGSTTAIDLRTGTVLERFDGVTTPIFGGAADRYVVAARDLLLVSYPERSLINKVGAELERPWQVLVTEDLGVVFVLERDPVAGGPSRLVAVDLQAGSVAYRETLPGEVVHMALSHSLRVLALADRAGRRALVVDPSTLAVHLSLEVAGEAVDVAFAGQGRVLAVAVAEAAAGGVLQMVELKAGRHGLSHKKPHLCPLGSRPQRLAVDPNGRRVAVGLAAGGIVIAEVPKANLVSEVDVPGELRDLVWCDPAEEGPLLPEWSDQRRDRRQLAIGFKPE
jgi:hypothetical protein